MILLKSAVAFDEVGKAILGGDLFTGTLLDIDNGIVKSKRKYKDGVLCDDESESPFTLYPTSDSEINGMFLEGDYEPYSYNGQLFNGVAYFFNHHQECVTQKQYDNGEEVSEAKYIYGKLVYLEHAEPDDSFTQKFIWNESGNVEHLSIFSREQFHVGAHFENNNAVSLLIFDGDYFKYIDEKNSLLLFDYIKTPSFFSSIKGSEDLNLSGSSIDNLLLNELVSSGCLTNTLRLEVYNTSVTNLDCLASLSNLQELYVESEVLAKENFIPFKSLVSNCYILLNHEEILS